MGILPQTYGAAPSSGPHVDENTGNVGNRQAPPRFEDRVYQTRAIYNLRQALRSYDSVILYAPTGSGKTAIACDITAKAVAPFGPDGSRRRQSSVLFIGDSTEIIDQTSETMDFWGVSHGIIQAGNAKRRPWELVHIATIQTLRNRTLPKKDLVFVDECHLSRAKSWHEVIRHYIESGAKVIGLSATPCRLDGKGLGALFQSIVYCPSIEELTRQGYLVPFRIFAPPVPKIDPKQVHTVAGDYNKAELAQVMDKAKLIGNAVEHYGRIARGRLAILAATSIEHSKHLAEAFRAAGIPAAHCDGTTPRDERHRILKSLPAREIMVLCQVDICGKGWDCREVSCAIDCRPTQSLARWLQFVGRAIRPAYGKGDAVLLDHSANVHRFGMPDEEREWSLDESAIKTRAAADPALSVTTCRKCFGTFRSGRDACPYCGAPVQRVARRIEVDPGQLEEIKRQQKLVAVEKWREGMTGEKRRLHFEELRRIGVQRGYKDSWCRVKFHALYNEWPKREWLRKGDPDPGYANPDWNDAVETLLANTKAVNQ